MVLDEVMTIKVLNGHFRTEQLKNQKQKTKTNQNEDRKAPRIHIPLLQSKTIWLP